MRTITKVGLFAGVGKEGENMGRAPEGCNAHFRPTYASCKIS
jgi:hypothetical protein